MNSKRTGLMALLVVWLCMLVAAAAQAQYDCGALEALGNLFQQEQVWYLAHCVELDDDDDEEEEAPWRPPDVTCPHLPDRVDVSGYNGSTQCQMVDQAGIGRADLIQRGVIDAVDVWNFKTHDVDVCFRNEGWLVFLDAAYAPRMLMELESFERDGMTCGLINRPGTVALLATAALVERDSAPTLPVFEPSPFKPIPLVDCQIKLVETLFLRAEPAGEIIGLVWLNSEVPAFEINGFWYKTEFEGKTGYISRYHRRVLRGGCG